MVLAVGLLIAVIVAVVTINHSHEKKSPENWTAFVYKNGYESAAYEMKTGFNDYQSCKAFSQTLSYKFGEVPWQCGLRCRFDSMRQGYQCETMENH
ncbi:hypothetical protein G3R48_11200 [Shewanella intestini]|uniref:Uncharacterized protein n=1 Tax=Shewanella intestini TaxID=2017544 RepID=A0ABS5I3D2_9GAMM|nr:hypothetical protein [Shewanella intestini]MRG36361.1 hypothetical protein [Shewanella sp. XMDDZSB0408]